MTTYKKISPHAAPVVTQTTLQDIGDGKIHSLTGVDFESIGSANAMRFCLDGKVYVGTEDESDGYRSMLADIEMVSGPPITNKFRSVKVRAVYVDNDGRDVLQLIDVKNDEVVLELGTDNNDDYYPSFVGWFSPEKMAVNAK